MLPDIILTMGIAAHIFKLTNENGGATFHPEHGSLAGRPFYAVSVHPERSLVVPTDEFSRLLVECYIERNRDLLETDDDLAIGTWVNEGSVHLDLSIAVPDREQALAQGRHYGQEAIFDLAALEDIPVAAVVPQKAA